MIRRPPAAVARQLRQEAGFGCAECGNPIIEYHHIIEWREKNHFEPEHMVALCPNHHTQYGKLSRERAYKIKQAPYNIRKGYITGFLGGNKRQKLLRLGSLRLADCHSAISFSEFSIFSYRLIDGEYQLNAYLPDANFWPEIKIVNNTVTAKTGNFWDIEYKVNWIKFRRKQGEVFLSIDFRHDDIIVNGKLRILGEYFEFSSQETSIGNSKFGECFVSHCQTGLAFGPNGKIHPPNYAMCVPRPILDVQKVRRKIQ